MDAVIQDEMARVLWEEQQRRRAAVVSVARRPEFNKFADANIIVE